MTELEKRWLALLGQILETLNAIPRTRVPCDLCNSVKFKDTYQIAAAIERETDLDECIKKELLIEYPTNGNQNDTHLI